MPDLETTKSRIYSISLTAIAASRAFGSYASTADTLHCRFPSSTRYRDPGRSKTNNRIQPGILHSCGPRIGIPLQDRAYPVLLSLNDFHRNLPRTIATAWYRAPGGTCIRPRLKPQWLTSRRLCLERLIESRTTCPGRLRDRACTIMLSREFGSL